MARTVELQRFSESARLVSRERLQRVPRRDQMTRRRHIQWLFEHEVGSFDPITRKFEPRSVGYLAEFYGVTERAVRKGLASARELTEGITNAARSSAG
jgi:hypothetical protein